MEPADQLERVSSWYLNLVRPVLEADAPTRVSALDGDLSRLRVAVDSCREQPAVCVLGHSGVGKSTLINALVAGDDMILPQGGIGPLTAQATSVRFSEEPFFEVRYHGVTELNRVLFALDRYQAVGRTSADDVLALGIATTPILPVDIAEETLLGPEQSEDGETESRRDAYLRRGRLLVRGEQYCDLELSYVADCLRMLLGREPVSGTRPSEEDARRMAKIREAIALASNGKAYTRRANAVDPDPDPDFLRDLHTHAAGFLAPLIRELNVGWRADLLRDGLVLVDLPGVGIANDEYRRITQSWVREEARGIALVVDRGGLTSEAAELLRSSGFFTRLLYATDDPSADVVELVVVIVKLDASATDARNAERAALGSKARPWIEHFEETCTRAVALVKQQVQQELQAYAASQGGEAREQTHLLVQRILAGLVVQPVAAMEYRKLLTHDPEDPARIKDLAESKIPKLAEALSGVAKQQRNRLRHRAGSLMSDFVDSATKALESFAASWDPEAAIAEEAEALRRDLEHKLDELRRGLYARQGAFRNFLRETLGNQTELSVENAALAAQESIRTYLRALEPAHWATLRATVRRGGAFVGARQVNLPADFATRFEDPVAAIWSKRILEPLRTTTTELATFYVETVEHIVSWAEARDPHPPMRRLLALRAEIQTDMRRLERVGKDAVDQLRQRVKAALLDAIEDPIRKRCQQFVGERRDTGSGTKVRILDFFQGLVLEVVEAAKAPCNTILLENLRVVEGEVLEVLDKYPDPLAAAAKALSGESDDHREGAEAQRSKIMASIRKALEAQPEDATFVDEAR